MTIKHSWWKFLCIPLGLYVLLTGMLVPLKPGIVSIDNYNAQAGKSYIVNVKGYNSNFDKAKNISAYLRVDSSYLISHNTLNASSYDALNIEFNIPEYLPTSEDYATATLILDNEVDGPSVLPGVLHIEQKQIDQEKGSKLWTSTSLKLAGVAKGFKFPHRNILNETIRNTFFHVAIWFAMFFLLILSLYNSIQYLRLRNFAHDIKASAYAEVAILFGLIGIATGSIWAKYAWGAFWIADVKLNMSAIALLIYVAYLILRASIQDVDSRARLSAAYNIFAFLAMIPLIFVIPRMTDSLHPGNGGNPALGGEDLDNRLRMVFYPAIILWSIMGFWMSKLNIRLKNIAEALLTKK